MNLQRIGETQASDNGIAITSTGTESPVSITINKHATSLPSILIPLLDKIISAYQPQYEEIGNTTEIPDVEDKISYNSVKIYADDIRENTGYMALIEGILDSIDDQNPNAKVTFLWAINKKYKGCKRKLFLDNSIDPSDKPKAQEIISANADKIIHQVATTIISSCSGHINAPIELVEAAQELIVCYGFINCQILEKPQ
ncbi:hypothetical protein [Shewanella sp. GutDb-MelDb]|uniref:hypothetical protein n=1 Tax=Shewanella sp. GutDb-MelDb TaxID=2058316 RepID=UPI000C7CEE48|nr:hypothetical protein [Shewanella sp. GutDb-MelDb]PKG55239.1 hypothetical protein CXF82_20640 [Shewanella sp. GutDb-MelDb]